MKRLALLCLLFVSCAPTIEALEALTGRTWIRRRRRELVSSYAELTWDQLRVLHGFGPKKLRDLVELLAAAAP